MKILFATFKYSYGNPKRSESIEQKAFLPAWQNNVEEVIPFWLEEHGFLNDKNRLQEELLLAAENEQPDIIFFVLMADEIAKNTLIELKKKYITINWFCDDQWRFDSFSKNFAPLFTYSITVDKYSIYKYLNIKYNNCILSQWGTFSYYSIKDIGDINYKYDISFVGARNATREWTVSRLKQSGFKVHCFGFGWEGGEVSYDEMQEIFRTSKINLNLSNSINHNFSFLFYLISRFSFSLIGFRYKKAKQYASYLKEYFFGKKKIEQIKARVFEIPGAGGFQLTQYALAIEDYYEFGNELGVFSTIPELIIQIKYYLSYDELRETIKVKGNIRTAEHTYNQRIAEVLDHIRDDKNITKQYD